MPHKAIFVSILIISLFVGANAFVSAQTPTCQASPTSVAVGGTVTLTAANASDTDFDSWNANFGASSAGDAVVLSGSAESKTVTIKYNLPGVKTPSFGLFSLSNAVTCNSITVTGTGTPPPPSGTTITCSVLPAAAKIGEKITYTINNAEGKNTYWDRIGALPGEFTANPTDYGNRSDVKKLEVRYKIVGAKQTIVIVYNPGQAISSGQAISCPVVTINPLDNPKIITPARQECVEDALQLRLSESQKLVATYLGVTNLNLSKWIADTQTIWDNYDDIDVITVKTRGTTPGTPLYVYNTKQRADKAAYLASWTRVNTTEYNAAIKLCDAK